MTTATRHCLICGSRMLLSRGEAGGIVVVVGVVSSLVRGIRRTNRAPSRRASSAESEIDLPELAMCLGGMKEVSVSSESVASFRDEAIRHHFTGQHYLCLRCGARQNRAR